MNKELLKQCKKTVRSVSLFLEAHADYEAGSECEDRAIDCNDLILAIEKAEKEIKQDVVPKYKCGDIVFLITDTEQMQRIVTGYIVRPSGVIYYLGCGEEETTHYELEIASDRNWKK